MYGQCCVSTSLLSRSHIYLFWVVITPPFSASLRGRDRPRTLVLCIEGIVYRAKCFVIYVEFVLMLARGPINSVGTRFLKRPLPKSIRNVHIKFTTKDLGYGPEELPNEPGAPDQLSPDCSSNSALATRWLVKAYYINKLSESWKALTLDLTDCYCSANGYWSGEDLVCNYFLQFLCPSFGSIPNLRIFAPEEAQEQRILTALRTFTVQSLAPVPGPRYAWRLQEWMLKDEPIIFPY